MFVPRVFTVLLRVLRLRRVVVMLFLLLALAAHRVLQIKHAQSSVRRDISALEIQQ